jgi:hypothetical protein
MQQTVLEHLAICAAIHDGDETAAAQANALHINNSLHNILAVMTDDVIGHSTFATPTPNRKPDDAGERVGCSADRWEIDEQQVKESPLRKMTSERSGSVVPQASPSPHLIGMDSCVTPPAAVTLGQVLYHAEAIMLGVTPAETLTAIYDAARSATHQVTGAHAPDDQPARWRPHITVCYSTSRQPAEPIIDALGTQLDAAVDARSDEGTVIIMARFTKYEEFLARWDLQFKTVWCAIEPAWYPG